MEAQTTEVPPPDISAICAICKDSFQSREPKLLPCLHTFCKPCILLEAGQGECCSFIHCKRHDKHLTWCDQYMIIKANLG